MAAEDRKAFLLRMDPRLWAELEAWSADELRSVNGQIEFILRDAVRRRRGPASVPAPVAPAKAEPSETESGEKSAGPDAQT